MLSDAWYPGWEARVDDVTAEVFPIYYNFRGVLVPEGKHAVVFVYEPLSFHAGLWLSAATFVVGGIAAAFNLRRLKAGGA
jgi:uncharacterized membrane protein YfhO